MQRTRILVGVVVAVAATWCLGQSRALPAEQDASPDGQALAVTAPAEEAAKPDPSATAKPRTFDHWVTSEVKVLNGTVRTAQTTSSWDELKVEWVVPFQSQTAAQIRSSTPPSKRPPRLISPLRRVGFLPDIGPNLRRNLPPRPPPCRFLQRRSRKA